MEQIASLAHRTIDVKGVVVQFVMAFAQAVEIVNKRGHNAERQHHIGASFASLYHVAFVTGIERFDQFVINPCGVAQVAESQRFED